jgi:hypothetical protein
VCSIVTYNNNLSKFSKIDLFIFRFGWFIPNRTGVQFPPILDHWKIFSQIEQTKMFRPSLEQMDFIENFLKGKDDK